MSEETFIPKYSLPRENQHDPKHGDNSTESNFITFLPLLLKFELPIKNLRVILYLLARVSWEGRQK